MKKNVSIILISILSLSMLFLTACGNTNTYSTEQGKIDKSDSPGYAVSFDDYELIDIKNLTSEADNLPATNSKYFKFEPYSTTGYTLCGWSDIIGGRPTEIVIPSTYNGKPVVEINKQAFYRDGNLTCVKMGKNIKTIGPEAFRECKNLNTVAFGQNTVDIRSSAFRGCSSLTEVTLPPLVTYLSANLFNDCTSLTKVNFPKYYYINEEDDEIYLGIKDFAVQVFKDCVSLNEIELPETLKTIGSGAFTNAGLTELTIPYSVKKIGIYSFSECKNLEITVYSSTDYDSTSFEGCKQVNKL